MDFWVEWASQVGQWVKNRPAMQETQETEVRSLDQEYPLEEGTGSPLLCSCQENPTDRQTWQVTDHRVAKSWT